MSQASAFDVWGARVKRRARLGLAFFVRRPGERRVVDAKRIPSKSEATVMNFDTGPDMV